MGYIDFIENGRCEVVWCEVHRCNDAISVRLGMGVDYYLTLAAFLVE